MKLLLLRHGATAGNLEKRFIGVTDDPLCDSGRDELASIINGLAGEDASNSELTALISRICFSAGEGGRGGDDIFVSPLSRCRETASIFFPQARQNLCEDFRECDFGILENHTHEEMMSNDRYVRFIESEKNEEFPGGENIEGFLSRCADCFASLADVAEGEKRLPVLDAEEICGEEILIAVVHGGTIMGIMNAFSEEKENVPYYKWSPANGHGYYGDVVFSDGQVLIRNAHPV